MADIEKEKPIVFVEGDEDKVVIEKCEHGTSLFSSQEIMNADSGLVVDTNKVFMDTGIYPKGW